MSNPSIPEHLLDLESERDSEHPYEHSQPRGTPPRERRAAARERRNRIRDREERRDRRRVPRDIKLKSVPLHLQLTNPISQYGRWYFHLKGYLITQDPNYKLLFEGGDQDNNFYHYQWSLARLITAPVVDNDAAYVAASRFRRHEDRPGTAALVGLADTYYQYDPMDHAQRLKTKLHRPIQPGNTLRGYIADLTRIK